MNIYKKGRPAFIRLLSPKLIRRDFARTRTLRQAFTLIELLLVMGIIGILATVVIVAINPTKQLGQANDVANTSKARAVSNALEQYYVESGTWPAGVSTTSQTVCSAGTTGDCLSLDDALTSTVTDERSFISEIPQVEGFTAPDSGFAVYLHDSAVQVKAKSAPDVMPRLDQPGRAYNFDGVDDYIDAASLTDATNMSFSFWAKDVTTGATKGFISNRIGGGRYFMGISTHSRMYFYNTGGTPNAHLGPSIPVNDGEWHHYTYVLDNNSVRLYFDNTEIYNGSITYLKAGERIFRIARDSVGYTTAKMSDVRIYNKALTEDEIEHVYTLGTSGINPTTTNLVAQYKMDDANSALTFDSSGNWNHGTKTNITANTFHYEGSDVPYSFQNEVGYTSGLAFDTDGGGINYADELTWIGAQSFDGDFSVDWVINDLNTGGVIGLENDTTPTPSTNYNNQIYNVQITSTGLITRKEGVVDTITGLSHFDGDMVTFARSGTDVTVAVNGVLRKTWTGDTGDMLYPALSLSTSNTLKATVLLDDYSANYEGANLVITDEFIPRNEAAISFDAAGNPLQYSGPSS